MAIPGRLELPTYGLGNRRSIRLSYGTVLIGTTFSIGEDAAFCFIQPALL
jgi:hypothetical protein